MAARKKPSNRRENVLKLKFSDGVRERLDGAARLDKLETNPWARRILSLVTEYRLAGLSLEVAYNAALEALSKSNPSLYEKIRAALAAEAEPSKRNDREDSSTTTRKPG